MSDARPQTWTWALVVAGTVILATTSPAWGKGKEHRGHEGRHEKHHHQIDPPTDKPVGPQVPDRPSPPRGETDPPTFAWWVEWAGYTYDGPFWTGSACTVALARHPRFARCTARRN